jgi:hypothetical protein
MITRIQNKFPWKGYVGTAILSSLVAYTILLIIAISLETITEVRTHTQATSTTRVVISLILPQIAFGFILSSFYANVRLSLKKPVLDKKPETTSEIDYSKRVLRRNDMTTGFHGRHHIFDFHHHDFQFLFMHCILQQQQQQQQQLCF